MTVFTKYDFLFNECVVCTSLINHLRIFVCTYKEIPQESLEEISLSLSLLQILSLISYDCKNTLCLKSSIEILLELLGSTILSPRVTPTDLPPIVAGDTLDTILCIIVGSPSATRTLEYCRGLEYIVRVLRRKGVEPTVRYVFISKKCLKKRQLIGIRRVKSLELLYFYLLPEESTIRVNNNQISKVKDLEYSPKSPIKKHKSSINIHHSSRLRHLSYNNNENENIQFKLKHAKSQSDLGVGFPGNVPKTPEKLKPDNNQNLLRTPKTPKSYNEVKIPEPIRKDNTRSVVEKKTILSNWLGNVDALVRGMEEAGVWKT